MTEIILSDIVALKERGLYQGVVALTWAFASGIGPRIVCLSRAFYQCRLILKLFAGWRIRAKSIVAMAVLYVCSYMVLSRYDNSSKPFEDLNLPLSAISFVCITLFLTTKAPQGSVVAKLKRIDWL